MGQKCPAYEFAGNMQKYAKQICMNVQKHATPKYAKTMQKQCENMQPEICN